MIGKKQNYILLDISSDFVSDSEEFKDTFVIKNKQEVLILAKNNSNNLYIIFGSLYMIWEFL